MYVLLTLAGFAAGVAVIGRVLRRREREGDFDALSPSSAARPGVRMFFDYTDEGWRGDGIDQRPPRREQQIRG